MSYLERWGLVLVGAAVVLAYALYLDWKIRRGERQLKAMNPNEVSRFDYPPEIRPSEEEWTAQRQAWAAAVAAEVAMTIPRRAKGCSHRTPYDAFVFEGDGPYYDFTDGPHFPVGTANALNFFRRIGAEVIQHDRRHDIYRGGSASDGQTYYYDFFLVLWPPAPRTPEDQAWQADREE